MSPESRKLAGILLRYLGVGLLRRGGAGVTP